MVFVRKPLQHKSWTLYDVGFVRTNADGCTMNAFFENFLRDVYVNFVNEITPNSQGSACSHSLQWLPYLCLFMCRLTSGDEGGGEEVGGWGTRYKSPEPGISQKGPDNVAYVLALSEVSLFVHFTN